MIELKNVRKSFGAVEVIKGVDIRIEDGEFAVFVGPSGCGKSTLLRMIAGLEDIDSGDLLLDGKKMNDIAPDKRGIAMVFQSYALYPHMSVAENMGFSLDLAKVPKAEIRRRVEETAAILQLTEYLDRRPQALSGGQRQRVAIGRAIIKKPAVILFDEPLSNLDASLRVQMRAELQKLHRELKATIIFVTHDQVEAMTMGDRIVVLNRGNVAQVAPPIDLYEAPQQEFVAGFIGSPRMNIIPASLAAKGDSTFVMTDLGWAIELPGRLPQDTAEQAGLGIRPEHVRLTSTQADFTAEVTLVERLGVESYVTIEPSGQQLVVRVEGNVDLSPGDTAGFMVDRQHCHLFAQDGTRIDLGGRP
ncbi:sn-glycerol-3-phosphate ABC transporter ATP-binding protein UgpC [Devosia sp.]|uniref:ABC transporter ATP-binding protein n=1 Tax=Devosia sp. TaxID=1871048 RepID=UPI002AFFE11E|nr:sn-glycerol-3-phosphate ABC transporter ATP-binding protein UgpC [Devosia sp.]